ncbi:MAG: hypothetical protein NZ522_01050, partial [Chitinophagales bacterium]|nr:hypothetical protein [Chitinophagales bacterium]
MGANITYECVGPGRYLVYLTMYRDCGGIDAESSHTLNFRSQQCNVNSSITLNRISGPTDITPIPALCGTPSRCASSNGQFGV